MRRFSLWNPVKELKSRWLRTQYFAEAGEVESGEGIEIYIKAVYLNISRHVESGEGIESSPAPQCSRTSRCPPWNPVKELKDRIA